MIVLTQKQTGRSTLSGLVVSGRAPHYVVLVYPITSVPPLVWLGPGAKPKYMGRSATIRGDGCVEVGRACTVIETELGAKLSTVLMPIVLRLWATTVTCSCKTRPLWLTSVT